MMIRQVVDKDMNPYSSFKIINQSYLTFSSSKFTLSQIKYFFRIVCEMSEKCLNCMRVPNRLNVFYFLIFKWI